MIIDDNPISGTKLSNNMDKAFSRDQLIQFLKKQNLLDESGAPTERGMKNGISYHEEMRNGKYAKWIVYDRSCQERIQKCIPHIQKEVVPKKERTSRRSTSKSDKVIPMNLSFLNDIPFTGFQILPIDAEFVVLDTETTGLSEADEVVEVGIIDAQGQTIYESLFSHTQPMNPEAAKVNKLSEEILAMSPCISEEAAKISGILEGKIVIGHNISFDERLLKQSFQRYGMDFPGFHQMIDSKSLAKKFVHAESYSLQTLANVFGVAGEEKHRAVDDCRWTLMMLQNLEKLLQIASICK